MDDYDYDYEPPIDSLMNGDFSEETTEDYE